MISFNESILDVAPTDELPLVSLDPPFGYTIGIAFLITLTAMVVTSLLVFYVCFHGEPEVKAH